MACTHPMGIPPDRIDVRWTTPFQEALQIRDFPACRSLFRPDRRPSLVKAFRGLAERATEYWFTYGPSDYSEPSETEICYRENEERLTLPLELDEEETIKYAPDTFLRLVDATKLPPSTLLLNATLPTEAAVLKSLADARWNDLKCSTDSAIWEVIIVPPKPSKTGARPSA